MICRLIKDRYVKNMDIEDGLRGYISDIFQSTNGTGGWSSRVAVSECRTVVGPASTVERHVSLFVSPVLCCVYGYAARVCVVDGCYYRSSMVSDLVSIIDPGYRTS